jgi:hypothetical protein
MGWKAKIQSIITQEDLTLWYDKALRGQFAHQMGQALLSQLCAELEREFPSANCATIEAWMEARGYTVLSISRVNKTPTQNLQLGYCS